MTDFAAENAFYLSATPTRIAKLLAQYEAFKLTVDIPGAIVECGVFKGASFCRLALLRELHCNPEAKPLIGFDTFGEYAHGDSPRDEELRARVVEAAGDRSIDADELKAVLDRSGCGRNVQLIAGDITHIMPVFCAQNPELKISLLNLDVDFHRAAARVLEFLWPRVSRGGVMLIDDYGTFEGETRAVDEYFRWHGQPLIRRLPIAYSPCYVVKE